MTVVCNFLQQSKTLSLAFAVAILLHVVYLGKGALYFPDESRYLTSFNVIETFFEYDGNKIQRIAEFIFNQNTSFDTSNRPGDVLVRMIPASFQFFAKELFGLPYTDPKSLLIAQFFNLFCIFGIAYGIYKIVYAFSQKKYFAQLGALTYLFIPASFLYSRHCISYDISLFLYVVVLSQLLKKTVENNPLSIINAVFLGAINTLALAVYPGYVFFWLINNALLLMHFLIKRSYKRVMAVVAFFAGVIVVFSFFQWLAAKVDFNYINLFFSKPIGITQGSFEEGFSFIVKHYWFTMNVAGMAILAISVYWAIQQIRQLRLKEFLQPQNVLFITFMLFMGSWIIYAYQSVMGSFVFYGRLIHMYVPILLIVFLLVLQQYKERVALLGIVLIILCSICTNIQLYMLAYPRDILAENKAIAVQANYINDYTSCLPIAVPPANPYLTTRHSNKAEGKYIILNASYLLPTDTEKRAQYNLEKYQVITVGKHPCNNSLYLMEGYSIAQRRLLKELNPKISIYQ